ncbi:hypothetical protein PVAP13_6KG079475 [Panicum virgatum]|uniref:Uncharacterized protein n=1 Tax=Panicum virgatum TaxID=38727 RepID=A0A8T0R7Z7_PANVG|nr:hypothetical protein PVAP13_6KG079475 [Panicum virgatum]
MAHCNEWMEASARGRAPTSSSCGDARGRRWRRGIGVQWQCPVLNPMPPPLKPYTFRSRRRNGLLHGDARRRSGLRNLRR